MVAMVTTAKAEQVARMAWTSTSVVETPGTVAMATAAKTAVWVWRPTPGPFRKSRGALMTLVTLLPQLRPLDQALAETQPRSGGGIIKIEAWDAAIAEAAAIINPGRSRGLPRLIS